MNVCIHTYIRIYLLNYLSIYASLLVSSIACLFTHNLFTCLYTSIFLRVFGPSSSVVSATPDDHHLIACYPTGGVAEARVRGGSGPGAGVPCPK